MRSLRDAMSQVYRFDRSKLEPVDLKLHHYRILEELGGFDGLNFAYSQEKDRLERPSDFIGMIDHQSNRLRYPASYNLCVCHPAIVAQ